MAVFRGVYKLENGATARVEPETELTSAGIASDRTKCRWDANGRALVPADHNYDLMEMVRAGEGQ